MRFRLVVDGEPQVIEAEPAAKGIRVQVDGAEYLSRVRRSGDVFTVRIRTKDHRVRFEGGEAVIDEARYPISISGIRDDRAAQTDLAVSGGTSSVAVRSPMAGRVARVFVEPGMHVTRGQTLVVLEAMKMRNELPAPRDGVVREVAVVEGESITSDRVVVVLEAS